MLLLSNELPFILHLFRILDSLEGCAKVQDGFILYEVIEIVRKICSTLEEFCDGKGIDAEKIEIINSLYPSIESSDYAGKDMASNVNTRTRRSLQTRSFHLAFAWELELIFTYLFRTAYIHK